MLSGVLAQSRTALDKTLTAAVASNIVPASYIAGGISLNEGGLNVQGHGTGGEQIAERRLAANVGTLSPRRQRVQDRELGFLYSAI